MADSVPVSELQLHRSLYPRDHVDASHVQSLMDALDMGVELPPIVVWRKTRQVVDGFHRVTATRKRYSDEALIAVDWRDYDSKGEAFEDAMRLNASHGLRFQRYDHTHAMERARALGVKPEIVSRVLKIPIETLKKRRTEVVRKTNRQRSQPSKANDFAERRGWVAGEQRHGDEVARALRELADRMDPKAELGPGELPNVMRRLSEARKARVGLRDALLEAASLFVWWAARESMPSMEAA